MEKLSYEEYFKTIPCKMMIVLAGYRRLASITGADYSEKIRRMRAQKYEIQDEVIDKNFLLMVETGYAQVSLDEAKLYARYIAQSYRYDPDIFIDSLMFEVKYINFMPCPDNFKQVLKAMTAITAHMRIVC